MAKILGIDIETPAETQERMRVRRLQAAKTLTTPHQQFGAALAGALGNIFGEKLGRFNPNRELAESRERAKAIADAEKIGNVRLAQETLEKDAEARSRQIVSVMQQQGATPAQIAQALEANKQSLISEKVKLVQGDTQNFVNQTIDHNVANRGMDEITAKQYARAEAALRLDKLPGEENKLLAQQFRDANTIEMRQMKQVKMEQNRLRAQTESAEAQTALSKRGLLEELSIEELKVEREMALSEGRRTDAYDGLIAEKEEARKVKQDELQIRRDDLKLRQAKEKRIANQLNTTEFGYLKEQNQVYDASRDMERSALRAQEQLKRAEAAGRASGKALDVAESMKAYMGMQDADISVAQKALAERAMQRAFSLKQAGAMSDAEFEAYMTAVPPVNASGEQWNEFLRLDAIAGAKAARRASFHADYLGGINMSEAYPTVADEGIPRGMEGLNSAWRTYEADIYAEIDEKYSRDNWGSVSGPTAPVDIPASSDDELLRIYGGVASSGAHPGGTDINVAP